MDTKVILLSAVMFQSAISYSHSQESIFPLMIGSWNHIQSGHSIVVNRNGDVLSTGGPLARVGGTISAGGNFAFEGRHQDGRRYRCVYYITFLSGNETANWRTVDQVGSSCPSGIFSKISTRQGY